MIFMSLFLERRLLSGKLSGRFIYYFMLNISGDIKGGKELRTYILIYISLLIICDKEKRRDGDEGRPQRSCCLPPVKQ